MQKEWLFGKTLGELSQIVEQLGMPRFSAKQIAMWLYQKRVTSIDQMSNISQANRILLKDNYQLGLLDSHSVATSSDGTKKYLFPTLEGKFIESAFIPDKERATLCVSSQVGCKMGCEFCMTGRQGFQHNISAGEIVNQIHSIPESESLTNVVYMGMGEPLDNLDEVMKSIEILTSDWGYGWSPTRITVSTIGVLPALKTFMKQCRAHLAISLHSPFHNERASIMPAEKAYPIADIIDLLHEYDFSGQRRVSFEYIVFKGINDSPKHVDGLTKLLNGLRCRINLIRFHAIPGSPFVSPDEHTMQRFRDALTRKGIFTTIRTSRGEDIQAACGLLSTKEQNKTK